MAYNSNKTGAQIDAAIDKVGGIEVGAQVNPALASQAEAEAGSDNAKMMTALRVNQAIQALGGGGGGAINTIYGRYPVTLLPAELPATIQLASTKVAANGVSFVAGDVFVSHVRNYVNWLEIAVCVALRDFTYSTVFGSAVHAAFGDLYTLAEGDVGDLAGYSTDLTITDAALTVGSSWIHLESITSDTDILNVYSDNTTALAGTPAKTRVRESFIVNPLYGESLINEQSAFLLQNDYGGVLLPCNHYIWHSAQTNITNKTASPEWVAANGVTLGWMLHPTSGDTRTSFFVPVGKSVSASDLIGVFAVQPVTNDPIYYNEAATEGDHTGWLTTTPNSADSIRIGTWQADNSILIGIS